VPTPEAVRKKPDLLPMKSRLTRRSFAKFSICGILFSGISGCGKGNSKGSGVNDSNIEIAAKELSTAIVACMTELRPSLENDAHIYAVVLVALDDFSDIQVYANTDQHLATTDGTDTDRWYFGEFWSEGMPVEFDALTDHLGEVEDWDEDEEPENSNAVDWLAAMTLAMQKAQSQGAFTFDGKEATIFCSIVDSLREIAR
jgi:hypothetical protein